MQDTRPNFLQFMRFGIELETLQSKYNHESNNSKTQVRLQYAQTLNNYRDSLINDSNKEILCKPYFHFQASPLLKSRERMPNSTLYKCEYTTEKGPTWTIDYDGSVRPNSANPDLLGNTEIISPPLHVSTNDLNNYQTTDFGPFVLNLVMKKLLPAGGEIKYGSNSSTSTHVHLSCISSVGSVNYLKNPYYLLAIAFYWQKYQNVFFNLVSESRRSNPFCKKTPPLNQSMAQAMYNAVCNSSFDTSSNILVRQIAENFAMNENFQVDRKYGLNLQNLVGTGIGTIEIRVHHGTMDPFEIYNWILLLSLFLTNIMNDVYDYMTKHNSKDERKQYFDNLYKSINSIEASEEFDHLFDTLIKSNKLKKYYAEKYSCGTKTVFDINDPNIDPLVTKSFEILLKKHLYGGRKILYKKLDKKIFIKSRTRCVYLYKRKQYVKIKNAFVPISSLR